MAFRSINEVSPLKDINYNSPDSKTFLEMYNDNLRDSLMPDADYIPRKAFTPSSIRCKRMNWFRLRGTKPDVSTNPDVVLDFIADIGTHCHKNIQTNLKTYLGNDWLNVDEYLKENPIDREYELKENGLETKIVFNDPPVRFSCDGLIRYNDIVYLLEIKTSEANSMRHLVGPKAEHLDQILCYCTLLNIDNAMVLYQDRQYGHIKCFTHLVTPVEKQRIVNTFEEVQLCVERNIPPEKLPKGDKWCSSSYCSYYNSCKRWG